jgi:hypothetical protein
MSEEIHYEPKQKEIFRYHNGKEIVAVDPLLMRGNIRLVAVQHGSTIDTLLEGANRVDDENEDEMKFAEAWQCILTLQAVAADAFQLTPEADLAHALGVVNAFYGYLEKKNPPTEPTPASMPSSASIAGIPQTTNTSSV